MGPPPGASWTGLWSGASTFWTRPRHTATASRSASSAAGSPTGRTARRSSWPPSATGSWTEVIITEKIDQSLQCLRTDWIDLFQIHHFPHDGDPLDEILESLERAVQAGKVRHLGLSNCGAWQFCKALWRQDRNGWARFESMQPSYSLVERTIEAEMIPLCKDQDVAIISYAPIASGFLAGKYSKGGPIPSGTRFDVAPGHQDVFFSNRNFACVDRIKAIAAEAGRSLVDLALAWAIFQPDITCVLIGGRKISHVDQAFETLERGLDPELRERLDQASQPDTFG